MSFLSTAFLGFLRMVTGFLSLVLFFTLLYAALSIPEVFWAAAVGVIVFASYKIGKY